MPMYSSGGITLPAPSRAARNVPTASKGHFTGHLVAGDGPGRAIQVESHLEMKTALVLLARPDVVDLEEQVPFEWADEHGEVHTHFFDFRPSLRGGARIAIAVKPRRRVESGRFLDTIQAIASQVMPDFADHVRVFTEACIDPVEFHSAELLHGLRHPDPDPEADAAARAAVAALTGAAVLKDLAAQVGLGARGLRALIRLIGVRCLCLVRWERITPGSLVQRTEVFE